MKQSAQQRAIGLINKFDIKYQYKFTKGCFPVSMHNSVIKECVLAAIDEILDVLITDFEWNEHFNGNVLYWKEVKEIVQNQFEAIKPKLKGMEIKQMHDFGPGDDYLINDFNDILPRITNVSVTIKKQSREVHETWNERIFLNACGIETEETFEITKETIIKYKMKDEFPEVFEVKLEVGKWYKRPHGKALFFIVGDPKITPFEVYGFDMEGNWMNLEKARTFPDYEIEATEQEVFEALKNEAVKRGFVDNTWVNTINNTKKKIGGKFYYYHDMNKVSSLNDSDGKKGCLFYKGQWATIIPTKTKEEAEKLLNCKIV